MNCSRSPQNLGDVLAYLVGIALVLLGWVAVAHAAGTVSTCSEASLNTALSGGGSVDFATGSACTITVTSTKTISADTTIDGTNGGYGTTISGGGTKRIFYVNALTALTLQQLTLTGGAETPGSVVRVASASGSIVIDRCTFTANGGFDGLVYIQSGTGVITNSVFYNNTTTYGAVYNYDSTTTVSNVTFSGNTGTFPNVVCFPGTGGSMSLIDSTINGGTGSGSAGVAIYAQGSACGVTVTNTIVTNSSAGVHCGTASGGTITNGGNNIDSGTSCGWGSNLGSMSSTDPLLDPAGLASNGGSTQTIALCLAAGTPASCSGASPAINAGDNTTCAASPVSGLDQRGYYRPGFGQTNCSIGAFEAYSDVSTPTPTPATTATPTVTNTPTPTSQPILNSKQHWLKGPTAASCQRLQGIGNGLAGYVPVPNCTPQSAQNIFDSKKQDFLAGPTPAPCQRLESIDSKGHMGWTTNPVCTPSTSTTPVFDGRRKMLLKGPTPAACQELQGIDSQGHAGWVTATDCTP